MAGLYPIFLRVRKRRVLVVGGGHMATVRVKQLLAAGARVTVVSPRFSRALQALARSAYVEVVNRKFAPSDVSRDYFVVIGATNHRPTQAAIAQEAEKAGILYNVVDSPEHSNFYTPAVVERGKLKIAIASDGLSPVLSGRLRRILDDALPQDAGDWTALLGELRKRLKTIFPDDMNKRKALINEFIERITR